MLWETACGISWMFGQLSKVFLCAVFFTLATASALALSVDDVRIGQNKGTTRIVFELDEATKPNIFTLAGPPRLVVDYKNGRYDDNAANVKLPPKSLVKKVRSSPFNPSTYRFVFDMHESVDYTSFAIPAAGSQNFRFVIDTKARDGKFDAVASKPTQNVEPSVTQRTKPTPKAATRKKPFIVVIDPGHGGVDPGAIGKHKTYEKDVVLAIGKRIIDSLNERRDIKGYLTRDRDVFLRLQDRVNKAQKLKADLFISIHADAHENRSVRGSSVYVLSETASDKEAARLARHANSSFDMAQIEFEKEPPMVRDILVDLAQRETMNQSAQLARNLLDQIKTANRTRGDKIRFAGFRVLTAPDIPSVLVELAYISNPAEERMLTNRRDQQRIATAVANGVEDYVRAHQ